MPRPVLINAGAVYLLQVQLRIILPDVNLWLRLFVNNHLPERSDNITDYTECSLPGYAPVELLPGSWVLTHDYDQAVETYPITVFNFNPSVSLGITVYGWIITDALPTIPVWGHYLESPFPVPDAGTSFPVALVWNDHGVL